MLELGEPALADPGQGLFAMGMDSLMALELRTRLETLVARALPATLVFDHPTIEAMARFLAPGPAPPDATRITASVATLPPRQDLDALSDEDAEALLLKKLESIQ